MGRLTKRAYGEITYSKERDIMCGSFCNNCSVGTGNCDLVKAMVEKLAELEDLEEQGRLLRFPFPLGSEYIYVVEKYGMKIYKLDAEKIEISKMPISNDILYEIDGFELTFQDFGEIAFLTQDEAEAKLKEMEEKQ